MANEEQISQFVAVTGSSPEQARFYLESANGDVDAAVSSFLDSGGADGGFEEGAMEEDDQAGELDFDRCPQSLPGFCTQ